MVNGYILFKDSGAVPPHKKKTYSQLDFRIDLYKALRGGFCGRKQTAGRAPRAAGAHRVIGPEEVPGHVLEHMPENERKKVCR